MSVVSLATEKTDQKSLPDFADIPDHRVFPCLYANNIDNDYFSLMVLNKAGKIMVIEDLTANSAWGSWHLVNGVLKDGENSVTAVKRKLLKVTGYVSNSWVYMGSYMLNAHRPDVAGHFFIARDVIQSASPYFGEQHTCAIKWVSPVELRSALLDGRIGMMNYAVAAALALLYTPA